MKKKTMTKPIEQRNRERKKKEILKTSEKKIF